MSLGPQRTCVGCGQLRPKAALVKLLRRADGRVFVDRAGTAPGRGAYVCPERKCVDGALKRGRLARAFRGQAEPSAELVVLFRERDESGACSGANPAVNGQGG